MPCSNFELRAASASIALITLFLVYQQLPPLYLSIGIFSLLPFIFMLEWPKLFSYKSCAFWLLPLAYPTISIVFACLLNQSAYRSLLPLACLLTFTHDSAAYFFGNMCGRNLLCPSISPKKTWEGLVGGYAVTYFVFLLYAGRYQVNHWLTLFLISISVSTLATLGDLFESWLKRRAFLKDSGSFLPGHGGILDRIDALLFVIPFFYLFKHCLVAYTY